MTIGQFKIETPGRFLEVRVKVLEPLPALLGVCAGYEAGEWRYEQLAGHLMEWLPEFALTERERAGIASNNLIALAAKAARAVYRTRDIERRGEIGEILLHAIIRQEFGTVPAISKVYFKDSENDTVKGFDAVHVVQNGTMLQLWLGESKFYKNIGAAITAVVGELKVHTNKDYLRSEFVTIMNKIDPTWPFAEPLKALVDRNTSLDVIFSSLCIPVFLSYESESVASHHSLTGEFLESIEIELRKHHHTFCKRELPTDIDIYLILFPMRDKQKLVSAFDERLKACQIVAN